MLRFRAWLNEEGETIHMSKYMDKGHPIPSDFSVHKPEFKNKAPVRIPISSLRYGQSAIRAKISPNTKTKSDDPISVAKNSDGTYTIGDGHHRTVRAIHNNQTHIMARVH